MTDGVRHSVYCLATDVLDEGAGAVLDNIAQRARVRSLTVAAKYHAVTTSTRTTPSASSPTCLPASSTARTRRAIQPRR
jgi:hypothetical protein